MQTLFFKIVMTYAQHQVGNSKRLQRAAWNRAHPRHHFHVHPQSVPIFLLQPALDMRFYWSMDARLFPDRL